MTRYRTQSHYLDAELTIISLCASARLESEKNQFDKSSISLTRPRTELPISRKRGLRPIDSVTAPSDDDGDDDGRETFLTAKIHSLIHSLTHSFTHSSTYYRSTDSYAKTVYPLVRSRPPLCQSLINSVLF